MKGYTVLLMGLLACSNVSADIRAHKVEEMCKHHTNDDDKRACRDRVYFEDKQKDMKKFREKCGYSVSVSPMFRGTFCRSS